MKTQLIAINAKYIHTNLAIRLLKANTTIDVDLIEYTIKDNITTIITDIVEAKPFVVGFSCYIWNIEMIKRLLPALKKAQPNLIILLGGPEVSFNPNDYINLYPIDYVIVGEGEVSFDLLLKAISTNQSTAHIPNLVSKTKQQSIQPIKDLSIIHTPHTCHNDFINRIQYIESSRGCPFFCSYCLASLDKPVRFFPLEQIKIDILSLMEKGAKTFKFLDRTFNTNIARSKALFQFIIDYHYPKTSFQFEITGDILPKALIDFIHERAPQNLFRFEIGIQSTNDETNKLVYRKQNTPLLIDTIAYIQNAQIIDLHLDLIAGLPKEDITSFANTFDQIMNLRPKELQLGFLKCLYGTKLYDEKEMYQYEFSKFAPYEIISNDVLSPDNIKSIRLVEKICDKYYNSRFMPHAISFILDQVDSSFAFFLDFGQYFDETYQWVDYNLDDLFKRLSDYLSIHKCFWYEEANFLLKYDYLGYYRIKPKLWWPKIPFTETKKIIQTLHQKALRHYKLEDLYHHCIIEKYNHQYLVAIYMHNHHRILVVDK